FFFQAEDGIRDKLVTGVQTVLFRTAWSRLATSCLEIQRPPSGLVFIVDTRRTRRAHLPPSRSCSSTEKSRSETWSVCWLRRLLALAATGVTKCVAIRSTRPICNGA